MTKHKECKWYKRGHCELMGFDIGPNDDVCGNFEV